MKDLLFTISLVKAFDHTIIECNSTYCYMMDMDKDKIIGELEIDFFPSERLVKNFIKNDDFAREEGLWSGIEKTILHKNKPVLSFSVKRAVADEFNKIAVHATGFIVCRNYLMKMLHHLDNADEYYYGKNIQRNTYSFTSNLKISSRQADCLFWLMRGKNAKEIGKILNISHRTVEKHIENMKEALNVRNKSQLIDIAYENDFIDYIPFANEDTSL